MANSTQIRAYNILRKLLMVALTLTLTLGCEEKSSDKGSFTDNRDGKTYKLVKIGNQVWMSENLNYNAKGSKCYDNNESNCQKYGRLYDWKTAESACPQGWHLSSWAEWDALAAAIMGEELAKGKHLKAKSGWSDNGNGLDSYGFSALPGGEGNPDGSFDMISLSGFWWSIARENDFCEVRYRSINHDNDYLGSDMYIGGRLFSVRCLQGEPAKVKEQECSDSYDGGS